MSYCVYCEQLTKPTREHVFPSFLNKRADRQGLYYSAAAEKYVEGAPVVRDVCDACNNETLSRLDDYASDLFDRYFVHVIVKPVLFQCDPNRLSRWLLKVMFNGQRAFGGVEKSFLPYRPYILGKDPYPPRKVFLFGGVMVPSKFEGRFVLPRDFRLSELRPDERLLGVEFDIAHMLTLNSFMLCVISLKDVKLEVLPSNITLTLKNGLGLVQFSDEGEIFFDPSDSRIDHVSHKVNQTRNKPWLFGRNGNVVVGNKIFKITAHPRMRQSGSAVRDNKLSLMSVNVDNKLFAMIGFQVYPPQLREIQTRLGTSISESKRAYAIIERRKYKTYVTLVDPKELGRPHLDMRTGIEQSDENWRLWRSAFERTGLIYLIEGVGNAPRSSSVLCAVPILKVSIHEAGTVGL
ncbi:hypothetical protein [Castellaniella sp.]|uniref:hypothetical protein n=1 Tax=Castellaniella sp. TaxID=1955812 RepID=UPI002AFFBB07|nr:hypothetical protein [Castellaniella sp.]